MSIRPIHDKFPRKKHVLGCAEHIQSNDNKQVLEEYKSKRILKKIDLIIRKKIKLLFHISNSIHISNKINQPIDLKDATAAVHNKANYI